MSIEPHVYVPVSQVEEVRAALNRQTWPVRWDDVQEARRLLHDMLSQPTEGQTALPLDPNPWTAQETERRYATFAEIPLSALPHWSPRKGYQQDRTQYPR